MNVLPLLGLYRCLGDEKRLRILHLLSAGPLCVCHIQEILGLSQVAASKHLAHLRRHGFVTGRRHEQWMIYSLPPELPRELEWQIRCLEDCRATHPILGQDLRALKARQPDCRWVKKALPIPVPAPTRRPSSRGRKPTPIPPS